MMHDTTLSSMWMLRNFDLAGEQIGATEASSGTKTGWVVQDVKKLLYTWPRSSIHGVS